MNTLQTKNGRRASALQNSQTPALSFSRILVPIDFSPASAEALRRAAQLAASSGATLELLHVIEAVQFIPALNGIPANGDLTEMEKAARRKLSELARDTVPESQPVFPHLAIGKPFERIVDFARTHNINLIVMPTQGRSGLAHTLIGSTAERVVQHAPCPVLVWREAVEKVQA